jgi:Protein of unknown function (DUF2726)
MITGTFELWVVVLIAALAAFLLWRMFSSRLRSGRRSGPFVLPLGAVLRPQPLLSEKALLLYNLIRLAVEDRYLVFAEVPLLSFLAVEAEGGPRLEVLRHLALKRADLLLVHPGSRVVEQVVQYEDGPPVAESSGAASSRDVQRLLHAAGIRVTTLSMEPNYTVQELERLLGMSDQE